MAGVKAPMDHHLLHPEACEWPGVYDPSVLQRAYIGKFFDNVGQSDHTQDSSTRANTGGGYFSDFGPIRVSWHEDSLSAALSQPWGFGSWQGQLLPIW